MFNPENPLIVQSDRSLLVEVYSPLYREVRDHLARFAELVRSPEHIHTYRLSALSLWNAAAVGMEAEEIIGILKKYAKYPVPGHICTEIEIQMSRYGTIRLRAGEEQYLVLEVDDELVCQQLLADKHISPMLLPHPDPLSFHIEPLHRGDIKQLLIRKGFPAQDLAGFTEGDPLEVSLRETTREGTDFGLRDYQQEAIDIFYAGGGPEGGHGVVVLPCGAGKTVVGIGTLARAGTSTLILATNISACRQWIREILDKTDLTEEEVGEYSGERKEILPVTVVTYQILTHRRQREDAFTHFDLFHARNWGLVIYDEVHLLPAPIFRVTGVLQARRRLGLTATLIREDGRQEDVFCLIGPKRYDLPWRDLEQRGFIATAFCHEIRVPLSRDKRLDYAVASERTKIRIAAENPRKIEVVEELCEKHSDDHILVIGQYLEQIKGISEHLGAPLITGKTNNARREELYGQFRSGELRLLVVSKVANFAIDLPDANVLIQVSGTFGSRQEEAQRLGRILRPKIGEAHFYSLVSRDTTEQEFSLKRQLFLTEQGYQYTIDEIID